MTSSSKNISGIIRNTLLLILGLFLLCIGVAGLYTFETHPRYIVLTFPLPQDDEGASEWSHTTYSTRRNHIQRHYIWGAEASLIYKNIPGEYSRESVITYFDDQLQNIGWVRAEDNIVASCSTIAAEFDHSRHEFNFSRQMEEMSNYSIVQYLREDYTPTPYNTENESVCLEIWTTSPGVFNVAIFAVKPSPLTQFLDDLDR